MYVYYYSFDFVSSNTLSHKIHSSNEIRKKIEATCNLNEKHKMGFGEDDKSLLQKGKEALGMGDTQTQEIKDDAGADRSNVQKAKDAIGVDKSKKQEAYDTVGGDNRSAVQKVKDAMPSSNNDDDK